MRIKNIKFWCLLLWILVCEGLIFPILAGYAMGRSGTGSPSGMCARLYFSLPNYRLNVPTESQQEPGDAASGHHVPSVRAATPPASPSLVWELHTPLKHRAFQLLPSCTPFQILLNTISCPQANAAFHALNSFPERKVGKALCEDSPVKRILWVPLAPSAKTAPEKVLLLQPK